MIEDLPTEIHFFKKILIFWTLTCNKNIFGSKNWKSGSITFCGIQCRFQNCLYFYSSIDSFWLLFFWRFKKHILQKSQIYIYIYKCIYWVLLWCLEAINASNQGTICFCTKFRPSSSFYILFFLWTWSFSMPFSIMTSPRYYDVTHFLTDLNENCTAFVKLKIKDILYVRIF